MHAQPPRNQPERNQPGARKPWSSGARKPQRNHLVETDSPFDMTYIAVVAVRDGRFASYRDYWNPLAVSKPGTDFTSSSR
jgi:hypothetical protein